MADYYLIAVLCLRGLSTVEVFPATKGTSSQDANGLKKMFHEDHVPIKILPHHVSTQEIL
jgi:hypothetical protein